MKKKTVKPIERQPGWLNQTEMAASCGISVVAFGKWGVQPVARIGRQAFYRVEDVIENRVAKLNNQLARSTNQPGAADGQRDLTAIVDPMEKLKAEKLEQEIISFRLRNSVLEGRSLPSWVVTEVISRVLSGAIKVFETLPLDIKRRHADLDNRVIKMFEDRIARIRNEAATVPEQLNEILDDIISEAEDRIR